MAMAFSSCAAIYRQITALDLDEIFSYQTTKEVRMLDCRLGTVNWLIRAIVLVYVIGYVFLLREGYTEAEKSVGHAISQVNGTSFSTTNSQSRPWDAIDAVQPALQNGVAFIATNVFTTANQTLGSGRNPTKRCALAAECSPSAPGAAGVCRSDNFCQLLGWIPGFDESDTEHTSSYMLESAESDFGVWLKSSIQFPSLDETRVLSTMDQQARVAFAGSGALPALETSSSSTLGDGAANPPDYFTVGELLALAQT